MALYDFVPRRNNLKVWVPVLGTLAVFPLFVRDEYILNTAIFAGIYVILASSLNITNGYTGLFSFGHAAFYGIGAYTAAILATRFHFPFLLTLPLAGIVAGAFGAAIALPTLRLKGIFLALVTIGFQQITFLVIMNWIGLTRGPMGLPGIPSPTIGSFAIESKTAYYYLVLVYLLLTLLSIQRLVNSRVGRAWIAIREDETAAMAMGIDTARYKIMAFSLGAFFAGIAGSFYAVYISFVSPDAFKMMDSYLIFAMPAVGGMGTMLGPLIGALIVYVLPEITRVFSDYRMLWVGALLVVVMVSEPRGVLGGVASLIERSRRVRQES